MFIAGVRGLRRNLTTAWFWLLLFSSGVLPARRRARRTASARLLVAMQSLDQENPPYTFAVCKFAGGGSISVLWMRDLVDAQEMDLRGSLMVVATVLDAVSASSLPGISLCPGILRRVVGR